MRKIVYMTFSMLTAMLLVIPDTNSQVAYVRKNDGTPTLDYTKNKTMPFKEGERFDMGDGHSIQMGRDIQSIEAYKIKDTSNGVEMLFKFKFNTGGVVYYREGESTPTGFGSDPLGCHVKEGDFEAQKVGQDSWSYHALRSGVEMCGIILSHNTDGFQVRLYPQAAN